MLRGEPGSGDYFEATVTVVPYTDGAGEERLVIALADREHALPGPENQPSAEETFASLSGYVSDIVLVFDLDGSLRYASPSYERLMGYTPEEVAGAVMIDTLHPDDFDYVIEAGASAFDSPGIAPPFTFRVQRKDGSYAHTEAAMNNMLADPEVRGVITILRDVTDRVQAEREVERLNAELERRIAELRDSESRFKTAFDRAAVGMAHLSPGGRYLRVNDRFREITGRGRDEVLGKKFWEIMHPDDLPEDEAQRLRMLSDGPSTEQRLVRSDGSAAWVSLSASLVRDASGEPSYFIVVAEDIDARKRTELLLASFTPREKEVLVCLARGDSNTHISETLFVSVNTVKSHVQRILEKLGVENRSQVAARISELSLALDATTTDK